MIRFLDIQTTIERGKNFCGVKNFSFFDRVDFQILPEEKIKEIARELIILCGTEIEVQTSLFRIKMDVFLYRGCPV